MVDERKLDERKPIDLEGRYKVRWANLTSEMKGKRGEQEDIAKRAKTQPGTVSSHIARTRRIGDKMAEAYEKAFKRPKGSMDHPQWGRTEIQPHRIAEQMIVGRPIKVVGSFDGSSLQTGSDEARVYFCTTDPGAYAIRVQLDWALPRFRHDEMLVIEPNTKFNPGDTVIVRLKSGEPRFGLLSEAKENHISLSSFAAGAPETILANRIENIHTVVAVLLNA